jgi:integrase
MVGHLEQFAPKDGVVFGGPKGGFLNRHNFYNRVWRPALELADLEDPQPRVHDLRHTAVSLGIKAGAHPKEIQARAGHSSIRITMDRYGHLFPGQDEALAERLDTLRPEGGFGIFSARRPEEGKVVPLRKASDQGK